MSHRVKRFRLHTFSGTDPSGAQQWRAQRNDLGETFGTKKAKSQIKAEERNKVDVGAMEGVRGHLMGSIAQRAEEEGMLYWTLKSKIRANRCQLVHQRISPLPISQLEIPRKCTLVNRSFPRTNGPQSLYLQSSKPAMTSLVRNCCLGVKENGSSRKCEQSSQDHKSSVKQICELLSLTVAQGLKIADI